MIKVLLVFALFPLGIDPQYTYPPNHISNYAGFWIYFHKPQTVQDELFRLKLLKENGINYRCQRPYTFCWPYLVWTPCVNFGWEYDSFYFKYWFAEFSVKEWISDFE